MYIFRFPADTPELTYAALAPLVTRACGSYEQCTSCHLKIGTTVTARWNRRGDAIIVRLYDLDIATLYRGSIVSFTYTDDGHGATREWIDRIIWDNALGLRPWRIRRRKSDGPGPVVARGEAGLLCMGGDRNRPVFGHVYPVNLAEVERRRGHAASRA